jgi:AcrR family transcriptional regulator
MIDATREIIASDGVRACTVDEVARRTGIAKTTIYRHFGGVDALVLASVDGMVRAMEPPDTGSLAGDLRVIQQRYLGIARAPAMRELYAWMVSRSMQDADFAAQFRSVRVQPQGATVIALQRAIARGEVSPTVDIQLAMHLIQGPFMSKRIMENEALTDDEFDALLGFIVRGLTTTSSGPPTMQQ